MPFQRKCLKISMASRLLSHWPNMKKMRHHIHLSPETVTLIVIAIIVALSALTLVGAHLHRGGDYAPFQFPIGPTLKP
jgi:hypothetical protein